MKKHWRDILIVIGITIGIYLVMKYMLPVLIPFLIAYLVVRGISPFIEKMHQKFRINRGFLASIIVVLFSAAILFILKISITKIVQQLKMFIENIDVYEARFVAMLDNACQYIQRLTGLDANNVNTFIVTYINKFTDSLQGDILPGIMNQSFQYIKKFIEIFTITMITFISVILLAKDFETLKQAGRNSVYYQSIGTVCSRVLKSGGTYLKAQLTIMSIIGAICMVGLFLIGNHYALLLGVLIGLMDALPVLGTGTVFVPWAVITILQGDFFHGAVYATLWIVTWIARELLEPKLIGKKLGLYPIAVVMTMYIGVKVYGLSGVLLGPASLLFIIEIAREAGVIKEKQDTDEEEKSDSRKRRAKKKFWDRDVLIVEAAKDERPDKTKEEDDYLR